MAISLGNTVKSFTGVTTATLMTALETQFADFKLVPISITQTSPFAGAAADYIVIFDKRRL